MPKLFISHSDPAMRYEKLIGGVYEKKLKYGDPLKCAAQDYYGTFVDESDLKEFHSHKVSLGIVIGVISYRFPEGKHIEDLDKLRADLVTADTQSQVIDVIDGLITLFETL